MIDFVVGFIIVVIISGSLMYIIRAKRRGVKCIGCPDSAACSGKCNGCNGSCGGDISNHKSTDIKE